MHPKNTRQARIPLGLVVIAVLVLAGVTMVRIQMAQASSHDADTSPAASAQANSMGGAYTGPLGIPAIHPRPAAANAAGARFTEGDVRQYVASHRPRNTVAGTSTPTVASVQFLPSAQVGAILHTTTGEPDSSLMCLVHVSGSFQITDVPLGAHPSPVYHDGVLVFDALTGNLLISSV